MNIHTFQTNEEKAFRVVIRHLHHTTPTAYIKEELHSLGFTTRLITNCLQYKTKNPLKKFFVDLEPSPLNQSIYKVDSICLPKFKSKHLIKKPSSMSKMSKLWTHQNLLPSHTQMCKMWCYSPLYRMSKRLNYSSNMCPMLWGSPSIIQMLSQIQTVPERTIFKQNQQANRNSRHLLNFNQNQHHSR